MKNIFKYLLLFTFFSCAEKHYEIENLNPAAKEVYEKIIFIEKQFVNFEKEKVADFSSIEEIVELSKICPKEWNSGFDGISFIPEKKDIKLWKKWFDKNKNLFSYDGELNFDGKRNIIKVEYEKGKFRRNFSDYIIENYKSINKLKSK